MDCKVVWKMSMGSRTGRVKVGQALHLLSVNCDQVIKVSWGGRRIRCNKITWSCWIGRLLIALGGKTLGLRKVLSLANVKELRIAKRKLTCSGKVPKRDRGTNEIAPIKISFLTLLSTGYQNLYSRYVCSVPIKEIPVVCEPFEVRGTQNKSGGAQLCTGGKKVQCALREQIHCALRQRKVSKSSLGCSVRFHPPLSRMRGNYFLDQSQTGQKFCGQLARLVRNQVTHFFWNLEEGIIWFQPGACWESRWGGNLDEGANNIVAAFFEPFLEDAPSTTEFQRVAFTSLQNTLNNF